MAFIPAAAIGLFLLTSSQTSALPADMVAARDLPVSLPRIRTALKKPPPRIIAPKIEATFRVEINERQRFRDLLDLIDFGSGPVAPGGFYGYQQQQATGQRQSQPLFNVNMTGVIQNVGAEISKARRERAERLAREEVRRALVDFCAANDCKVP
jgi:hypothetical protein